MSKNGKLQSREGIIDRALLDLRREFPKIDQTSKGIVYSCRFLSNHFSLTGAQLLEQFELTEGEYSVISTLRRAGVHASMSPSAICKSIRMTSGGLSNLLRGLERRGLIKRVPSKEDGRGVLVEVTARGRRLAEDALQALGANQFSQLAPLSIDERKHIYAALRMLVRHFETSTAGSSLLHSTRSSGGAAPSDP